MSEKKRIISAVNEYSGRAPGDLVTLWLLMMFTVFPLYFSDRYFYIRHDKLNVYLWLSCAFVALEAFVFIALQVSRLRSGEKFGRTDISVTDIAFAAFIVLAAASTLLSEYPDDSLFGSTGRGNGLLLLLVYFSVYVFASRFFVFREYVFVTFAAACAVVYGLCILNFFGLDPLNMYFSLSAETAADFTSTIGNKNMMSAFCCMTVPLFSALYIIRDDMRLRAVYLALSGLGFGALLCADSEGGLLGILFALAFVLLYCSRRTERLMHFFLCLSVMLICSKLLGVFELLLPAEAGRFGMFNGAVVYGLGAWLALGVCALITVALNVINSRGKSGIISKSFTLALGVVLALSVVSAVAALLYFTLIDTETPLGPLERYLRFGDRWGTHRGFMWIKSFEILKGSGAKNILLGSGPDTFYHRFEPYFPELLSRFGDKSTDCAHNEFINYLITNGVLGLAAYIALFGSAVAGAVRSAAKNPLAVVFAAPVVGYLAQSFVSLATPVTTPLLFLLLSLCAAVCRE